MFSSLCKKSLVWLVLYRRMSLTLKNTGLLSTITQALGETDISQSVNAYRASMVMPGDWPGASWIWISTSLAVLSTTFFILIFPFSLALIMDSIKELVVVPNGI